MERALRADALSVAMLDIAILPVLSDNYIYLLHDSLTGQTAAVDPAEAGPVLTALQHRGWRLDYVLNTHHHGDHIGGNLELKRHTGCRIVGAAADRERIPGLDIGIEDGGHVALGAATATVLATPGHTSGHIVFYFADSAALFCGDTLFSLGCGRLFEGSAAQMWQSLQRLKALPAETRVYCAHEYTQANGRFALTLEAGNAALQQRLAAVAALRARGEPSLPSSIGLELATNPFLREDSAELRAAAGFAADAEPAAVFAGVRRLKDHFH